MDWSYLECKNFRDFADKDRISALLLCEILNLNFEYFYDFDKQTGYVDEWACHTIYVYPSIQDFALEYLYQGIEYQAAYIRGRYDDIPNIEKHMNLDAFGKELLEKFGVDYAQLLPNGKIITTGYGW